jgi:hypothetical protein
MRGILVVVACAFVAACGEAPDGELDERPPVIVPHVEATPPPVPAPTQPIAAPEAGASSCEAPSVDGWRAGVSCVPEGPGEIYCSDPPRSGWTYACADDEGKRTRPGLAGCVAYGDHDDPSLRER